MYSEILREHEEGYVVRVRDNDENEHRVLINGEGEVLDHDTDPFVPPRQRTEELNALYQQVYNQAAHRVHEDTDHDVVSGPWRPEYLERAIEALEACPEESFARLEPFYEELQNPSTDLPKDQVFVVYQPMTLTDDFDDIASVGRRRHLVESNAGEYEWRGPNDSLDVALQLPLYTFEWEFGERFRQFLLEHLRCQVRDAYLNRGEQPPEEYQVDGFGKINYAGDSVSMDSLDQLFDE